MTTKATKATKATNATEATVATPATIATKPTQATKATGSANSYNTGNYSDYEKWLIDTLGDSARSIIAARKSTPANYNNLQYKMQDLQAQALQINKDKADKEARYKATVYDFNDGKQVNSLVDAILSSGNNNMDLALGDFGRWLNTNMAPVGWATNSVANTIGLLTDDIEKGVNITADVLKGKLSFSEGMDLSWKLAQGKGTQTLVNLSETFDVLGAPIRGFIDSGWKGFTEATVGGEEGRKNFSADTGSGIGDFAYEFATDPLNWLMIPGIIKGVVSSGVRQGAKLTIKEIAEGLAKNSADNITAGIVKTNVDEAAEYLTKQYSKSLGRGILENTTIDALNNYASRQLVASASKKFGLNISQEVAEQALREVAEGYMQKMTATIVNRMAVASTRLDDAISGFLLKSVLFQLPVYQGYKIIKSTPVQTFIGNRLLRKASSFIINNEDFITKGIVKHGIIEDLRYDVDVLVKNKILSVEEGIDVAGYNLRQYVGIHLDHIKSMIKNLATPEEIIRNLRKLTTSELITDFDKYIDVLQKINLTEYLDDAYDLKKVFASYRENYLVRASLGEVTQSHNVLKSSFDNIIRDAIAVKPMITPKIVNITDRLQDFIRNELIKVSGTRIDYYLPRNLTSWSKIKQSIPDVIEKRKGGIDKFIRDVRKILSDDELGDFGEYLNRNLDSSVKIIKAHEHYDSPIATLLERKAQLQKQLDGTMGYLDKLYSYTSVYDFKRSDTIIKTIQTHINKQADMVVAKTTKEIQQYNSLKSFVKKINVENPTPSFNKLNNLLEKSGDINSLKFKYNWLFIKREIDGIMSNKNIAKEIKNRLLVYDLRKLDTMLNLYATVNDEALVRMSDLHIIDTYNSNPMITASVGAVGMEKTPLITQTDAVNRLNKLFKNLSSDQASVLVSDAFRNTNLSTILDKKESFINDLIYRINNYNTYIDPEYIPQQLNKLAKETGVKLEGNIAVAQQSIMKAKNKLTTGVTTVNVYYEFDSLNKVNKIHLSNGVILEGLPERELLDAFYTELTKLEVGSELVTMGNSVEDIQEVLTKISQYRIDQNVATLSVSDLLKTKCIITKDYITTFTDRSVMDAVTKQTFIDNMMIYLTDMQSMSEGFQAMHGRPLRIVESYDETFKNDLKGYIKKMEELKKADPTSVGMYSPELKEHISKLIDSIDDSKKYIKTTNLEYRSLPIDESLFQTNPELLKSIQNDITAALPEGHIKDVVLNTDFRHPGELLTYTSEGGLAYSKFNPTQDLFSLGIKPANLNSQSIQTVKDFADKTASIYSKVNRLDDIIKYEDELRSFLKDMVKYAKMYVPKGSPDFLNTSSSFKKWARLIDQNYIDQLSPQMLYARVAALSEIYLVQYKRFETKQYYTNFRKLFAKHEEVMNLVEGQIPTVKRALDTDIIKLDTTNKFLKNIVKSDIELKNILVDNTITYEELRNLRASDGILDDLNPIYYAYEKTFAKRGEHTVYDEAGKMIESKLLKGTDQYIPTEETHDFYRKVNMLQNKKMTDASINFMRLSPEQIRNYIITQAFDRKGVIVELSKEYTIKNSDEYAAFLGKKAALKELGLEWKLSPGGKAVAIGLSDDILDKVQYDDVNKIFRFNGEDLEPQCLDNIVSSVDNSDAVLSNINNMVNKAYDTLYAHIPEIRGTAGIINIKDVFNNVTELNKDWLPKNMVVNIGDTTYFTNYMNSWLLGGLSFTKEYIPTTKTSVIEQLTQGYKAVMQKQDMGRNYLELVMGSGIKLDDDMFKGFETKKQIIDFINNDPFMSKYAMVYIKDDKHYRLGMYIDEFRNLTENNFDEALKHVRLVNYDVYEHAFRNINEFSYNSKTLLMFSKIMQAYKVGYLILSPGFLIRNLIDSTSKSVFAQNGNIPQTFRDLGSAFQLNRAYDDILKSVQKVSGIQGQIPMNELRRYWATRIDDAVDLIDEATFWEIYRFREISGIRTGWNMQKVTQKIVDSLLKPNTMIEDTVRLAQYIQMHRTGQSLSDIVKAVTKTHFNYDIALRQESLIKFLIPFYTFYSNNIMYLLRLMEENPALFRKYMSGYLDLQSFQDYSAEDLDNMSVVASLTSGNMSLTKLFNIGGKTTTRVDRYGRTWESENELTFKTGSSILQALQFFVNPVQDVLENTSVFVNEPLDQGLYYLDSALGNNEKDVYTEESVAKKTYAQFLAENNTLQKMLPIAGPIMQRADTFNKVRERTGSITDPTMFGAIKGTGRKIEQPKTYKKVYNNYSRRTYSKGYTRKSYNRSQGVFNKIYRPAMKYNKIYPAAFKLASSRATRPITGNWRPNINRFRFNVRRTSYASYIQNLMGTYNGRNKLHNWNKRELTTTRYNQASKFTKKINKQSYNKNSTRHYQYAQMLKKGR